VKVFPAKLLTVIRRLGTVALLGALMVALTACEPWLIPTDPSQASMSISLGAEGGASVKLILGGQVTERAPLLRTGNAVAAALFPTASKRSSTINTNMGGYPYVDLHAAGVYQRGAHPAFTIDTQRALAVMAEMGYRQVDVDIDAGVGPATATWASVPASSRNNDWSWPGVVPGDPAPAGTIQLDPQPRRGINAVALEVATFTGFLLAALGMWRRSRRISGLGAFLAAAVGAIGIAATTAVEPEDLGVAGLVNGVQLNIIKWALYPCLAAAVAAVVLFLATIERTKPAVPIQQFNAPPGWPPPPAGWMPMPGWQPDPTWPPPPPGWSFNVNPYEPPAPRRHRPALLAARAASRLRRSRRPGGRTPSL
jgi:hypothetical protein